MNTKVIISAVPCPRRISRRSSANLIPARCSPRTMPPAPTASSRSCANDRDRRGAGLPQAGSKLGAVRIHSKLRNFAPQQLLLHALPVIHLHQFAVLLAEAAAREGALELHAVLELLGKENHAILEKPGRDRFLARLAIGIGPDLHLGEFLDGVVVEQEHPAVASDAVIPGIQIFVEYVGGRVVADAMTETGHDGASRVLIGVLEE